MEPFDRLYIDPSEAPLDKEIAVLKNNAYMIFLAVQIFLK